MYHPFRRCQRCPALNQVEQSFVEILLLISQYYLLLRLLDKDKLSFALQSTLHLGKHEAFLTCCVEFCYTVSLPWKRVTFEIDMGR